MDSFLAAFSSTTSSPPMSSSPRPQTAAAKAPKPSDSETDQDVDPKEFLERGYGIHPGVSLMVLPGWDKLPKKCGYCREMRSPTDYSKISGTDPVRLSAKCIACVKAKNNRRAPGLQFYQHYTLKTPVHGPYRGDIVPVTEAEIDRIREMAIANEEKDLRIRLEDRVRTFNRSRKEVDLLKVMLTELDPALRPPSYIPQSSASMVPLQDLKNVSNAAAYLRK